LERFRRENQLSHIKASRTKEPSYVLVDFSIEKKIAIIHEVAAIGVSEAHDLRIEGMIVLPRQNHLLTS
jgi:hypothetical protein